MYCSALTQRPKGKIPWAIVLLVAITLIPLNANPSEEDQSNLGVPPVYKALVEARLEAVGRITASRVRIDRFEFELTSGDLYMLPRIKDHATVAVYLGKGVVRCYPPDGVEHQQVKRFLDEDFLEERFDRFIFWVTDKTADQLSDLAKDAPGRDAQRANDLLDDHRKTLFERQKKNPDSRVLIDLLQPPTVEPIDVKPTYFYAQVHGNNHGWFSIEIEPREREEVKLSKFDHRRKLNNVWMGFHALTDFDADISDQVFTDFSLDRKIDEGSDQDNWDSPDLLLSPRLLVPTREKWSPRMTAPRVDVDISLESNGDATASAALILEPQEPLIAFRLRISKFLKVTSVRWRTAVPREADNVREVTLLGHSPNPEEPATLTGDPLHFVQETHNRWLNNDLHEPWLTIVLPRVVSPGEQFVLEIAYTGELFERLRDARGFLLKDTLRWVPNHPDNRRSRMHLTYRVPKRYQIASGMVRIDERIVENTRIAQWVSDIPVSGMSFSFGHFDITETDATATPVITVYENKRELGFSPGNLRKTIEDLKGSIRVYDDYFGPYPFGSLIATETVAYNGQAFPGLVLLSFQAFGQLHTGEAELFRAHEVAHQWWGAAVAWESYRDQWISEGFSHYAAALYILTGLGDQHQFRDILDAWHYDVLGQVNVGQGIGIRHYGFRPEVMKRSDGHESGPVVAGYRLNSSDTPVDYQLLVYEKGAFILHMLRMMLLDEKTGGDTRFQHLMRSFVRDHLDKPASTQSFEAAVTRTFGQSMRWFFDQWVYGIDVPTYRPDLQVSRVLDQSSPYLLHGMIRQEDVGETFRMPVPIMATFAEHEPQLYRIWVDAGTVPVEIPLPAEPTAIEFNYQHAVLAQVR